jgi:hypothetical protein
MHIIPRKRGDFKEDQIYDEIRTHDKGENLKKMRSEEEMSTEANELRRLFGYYQN